MYLKLKYKFNLVLLILLYQCVTILSSTDDEIPPEFKFDFDFQKPEPDYCFLAAPLLDAHNMPIMYKVPITGAKIHVPDKHGNLFFGRFDFFQLSCAGGTFVSPERAKGKTEITAECLRGETFIYENSEYKFDLFRCSHVPRAILKGSNKTCNGVKNGLYSVGFKTKRDLNVYKVCHDKTTLHTLYTWHYVHAPVFKKIQTSKAKPRFISTEIFDETNVKFVYDFQANVIEYIAKSDYFNVSKYIVKSAGRFLRPSRLTSSSEYFYISQQHATYFYENTVPQWAAFGRNVWSEVKKLFERNLLKLAGEHLIVSGTFNTSSIRCSFNVLKPLILYLPDKMPVPQYVWKMIYNVEKKNGTVIIGINTPDKVNEDETMHFCKEIPCPGQLAKKSTSKQDLTFCCTKESFEKVYGPIDPVVFKEF